MNWNELKQWRAPFCPRGLNKANRIAWRDSVMPKVRVKTRQHDNVGYLVSIKTVEDGSIRWMIYSDGGLFLSNEGWSSPVKPEECEIIYDPTIDAPPEQMRLL